MKLNLKVIFHNLICKQWNSLINPINWSRWHWWVVVYPFLYFPHQNSYKRILLIWDTNLLQHWMFIDSFHRFPFNCFINNGINFWLEEYTFCWALLYWLPASILLIPHSQPNNILSYCLPIKYKLKLNL